LQIENLQFAVFEDRLEPDMFAFPISLGDVDGWVNQLVGNQARLIQVLAVGMVLALFIIRWRR